MDGLNRAIDAAAENAAREPIIEGLRGIATSFQSALANAGVEAIVSVGEEFNPELHEAVDTEETTSDMDGRVIEEYSRGFRMGDRLLRPARVKVGRASEQAREATEQ
jgi:molecular chaperone GrpE